MLVLVVIIITIVVSIVALMLCIRVAMYLNRKASKVGFLYFLKAYFEGKRQYAYFSIYFTFLTAIGGPSLLENLKANFEYQNESTKINVGFSSNIGVSDSVVIILCLVATFVYFMTAVYPRCKRINISQLKRSLEVINNEFEFQPNDDWFFKITKKAIKDLGNRYDENRNYPYKNIDLVLACLKKDKSTLQFIENGFEKVYEAYQEYNRWRKDEETKESASAISTNIQGILAELRKTECTYDSINIIFESTKTIHNLLLKDLSDWYRKNPHTGSPYDINRFIDAMRDFQKMLSDTWVTSLRSNTVLVNGNGGVGKSHFLADVANKRIKAGDPTILCLGMHITSDTEPLLQILSHIDVRCKKDTFLKTLNDYGKRVVLIVDGINEGAGIPLWRNHLESLINEIAQYENIQLVVSFRSSGGNNFLDSYAKESNLSVYTHEGFADSPKAIEYVFQSFGLDFPSFPFFGELFSNPMFLTLYCRSHELSGKSIKEENKWQIIKDYVKALNANLSDEFSYLKDVNLVEKSLMAIANKMIEQGSSAINLNVAQTTVDGIVKSYTTKSPSFLQAIINEGLLMTFSNGQETDLVFGYESIGNMVIAYNLINNYPVNDWLESDLIYDMKILSYLAPEKEGKELFEYVDPSKRELIIRGSFLPTCKWNPIKTKEGRAVVECLLKNKDYSPWFKLALETAYDKNSYVNASMLSHELLNMDFKERDAIWTTCISDELSGVALRLAHWGWGVSQEALKKIGDSEIALTCEALIWCLSSTNIKLRDITTKALVNILCNKAKILCELLIKFYDVDDLYISERLWAVAMGCCLNKRDKNEVASIAQTAYDLVF